MLNRVALAAVTSFLLGPALAWLRVVPPLVGFALFALGGLVALVTGVVALVRAARGRGIGGDGALAVAAGALFVAFAARGMGHPRINDFTTNPGDPPAFRHAATLPGNAGRDLSYPAAYAAEQRACCADLRPARLAAPPADALARVRQVAEGLPDWTVTQEDAASGTLEAVVTSRLFGFADDVVVRVRPAEGGGSRVDVRSKSRDGKGDLGANAARIRVFVVAVEGTGNATP